MSKRCRFRELGLSLGILPSGKLNAITDVAGVRVGHSTIVDGTGPLKRRQGPVRTGVTVVLPHDGDLWNDRVSAGSYVLNGNGVLSARDYVEQSGVLEAPVGLTNTHSYPDVARALVSWMIDRNPRIGVEDDPCLPVVGECYDGILNDIQGFHVTERHVREALDSACSGTVQEGAVGAGTGMICYGFKGGIGTASRLVRIQGKMYTLGVLVNCNHGKREQLMVSGLQVGKLLDEVKPAPYREGSIIIIAATDAPLNSRQLGEICKRTALGLARTGSAANNSSGDFMLAFSTTRRLPRASDVAVLQLPELMNEYIDPLFQAAVESTEEAVLNALCMAETVVGRDGNVAEGLPLERLREILKGG